MELNLKNLAPLLQCTSINRYALFITSKRKKYYFIKFLSPLLLKKYFFLFLSFLSLSPTSLLSSSFFLFQSSILIRPASLLSPLLRSSVPTTPHCPAPTEVQPSADHSLRSPPQRPNLRAPPSLCYLMPSADVGLCLCFPICCGQVGLYLCLWQWACARCGFFFFFLLWTAGSGGGGGCACG